MNLDNVFLTRLKRVNRLRKEITNGALSMRQILEEAERVLAGEVRRMTV